MPGWWFHHFEPVWGPFIQWHCRQKKMTLLEFERVASQVPGLTHIEKTIAISAFRQQQEDGLLPSTTPPRFAVNAVCPPFDRLPTFRLSWL